MSIVPNIAKRFRNYFPCWIRVEPRARSSDISKGLQAQIADPLWMLTRQWQMGEFQGEDAASPIRTEIEFSTLKVDEVKFTENENLVNLGHVYKPSHISGIDLFQPNVNSDLTSNNYFLPTEVRVENERFDLDWRTRIQVGRQFEVILQNNFSNYAATLLSVIRNNYLLAMENSEIATLDKITQRFINIFNKKILDGKKLLLISDEERVNIATETDLDRELVDSVFKKLLEWYTNLYTQPMNTISKAWKPQELEYEFKIQSKINALGNTGSDIMLSANEYRNGDLDWYSYKLSKLNLDWSQVPKEHLHAYPTRISVNGASPRWWEFEDSAVDFGKLEVAKPDLAKLLLMEFALIYGDDWFSVPLQAPMGHMIKINKLKVYDVFSVHADDYTLVKSARQIGEKSTECFDMFTLSKESLIEEPINEDLLYLPQVAGFREESEPIEEIYFLRDEGANMVWGIEHSIPNGLGKPIDGYDAQRERREQLKILEIQNLENELKEKEQALLELEIDDPNRAILEEEIKVLNNRITNLRDYSGNLVENTHKKLPSYRLSTSVPENWIPFVPTACRNYLDLGYEEVRLRRAQMFYNTTHGKPEAIKAKSRLLDMQGYPLLWLKEETVTRGGLRVLLTKQRMRWVDGKTYVWLGRKVLIGRGEKESGLRFDLID